VKTEVKNLNSFKAVEEALRLEEERQREVLAKGGKIKQQTLGWDAEALVVMRTKEEAEDYRYFPEPDLVPLEINEEWKLKVKKAMPELPKERQLRWKREYELPDYDIKVLCEEKHIADYFEAVVKKFEKPKEVSNWMMSELLRLVKEDELVFERLRPAWFAQILRMVEEGKINRSTGKELIEESLKTGRSPQEIVKERSLIQITDEASLLPIVEEVIASNPQAVADFKSGNHKVLGFLIGQVMRETKGKANPKKTGEILKKLITP
jgi:aspartyl-tRNA(Asn)/glutamyl-tRNA(Gln) amidotransferase subunit B